MRILAALFVLAALTGVSALTAQAAPSAGPATTLSPGDTIRIVVWRKPEFSGDFVIGSDGTITHPLYRAVRVAGLPIATAEANIRRFLSDYDQNPQFVIEPLISVAVSGEVSRPSVFAVQPKTSIAEAVARAGGTTQNGKRDHVRVLRIEPGGARRELFVNLKDPADPVGQAPVQSGDQVVVDRNRSFFKDVLLPTLSVLGSLASIGLLIRRFNN
ncbi:MAG: polysaccharide biosynthesis/export family protein [Gemmatimonadales bacterium]